ncbi:c-type cytochrome [Thermomicrobium sp. 4228-Ro]|uniref:cytochrome c n=1 Tax=Thermomicrobium sp. 4228-Ro TaxID=2993937 RepID=UPI0022488676|nr:c-type cytochrome [Thermomicrobium sp. 4228-Ro]MCX2726566.1 c-type cytochrome [Thermomicrobium sp. 4228-Ro]
MGRTSEEQRKEWSSSRWPGRLLWFASGMIATVLFAACILWFAGPALLSHRTAWPFERTLSRWAIDRAAAVGSRNAPTPPAVGSRGVETGRIVYLGTCAPCHGADADGKGWFGTLSYPPASRLDDEETQARSDAELYWIIAHGLSFTGMPGFAARLSDEQIWAVIAYLRTLRSSVAQPLPVVPTPSTDDLRPADPAANGAARGAALYFSLGCVSCHGPRGNAPGFLQLRATDRRAVRAIREGTDEGMPAYPPALLSDADLEAILAYIRTFRAGS